jgi:serine/threonine protein kinase
MSPEQARGAAVDARSDIFSFGAVLYEMVTGRRAFAGTCVMETLAAVIDVDPKPPSEVAPGVPKDLERLILRCLRKDPARRIQHMADVKVELLELQDVISAAQPVSLSGRRRRSRTMGAALALLAVTAITAVFVLSRRPVFPPARLVPVTTTAGAEAMPTLSPDGNQVATAGG